MMKSLLSTALLLCAFAELSLAQKWEVSPLVSYPRWQRRALGSLNEDTSNRRDEDSSLRGKSGFGLRLTMNTPGYYGHEIGYIYNDATFRSDIRTTVNRATVVTRHESKVKVQQAFYNFMLYMMPAGERIRPFITGGLQAYQYGAPRIPNQDVGTSRHYGGNFGGGIKFKLIEHLNFRIDVRDYLSGVPYDLRFIDDKRFGGGLWHQLEGSAGFSITF